jgi:hypothetical protein
MNRTVRHLLVVLGVLAGTSVGVWADPAEPGAAAAAAVRMVSQGLAQDRPVVLWDALPASKQKSISALLSRCAAKLDAPAWRHGFESVERMGLVLSNKQELVRGSAPAIGLLSMSSENRDATPWFRLGPLLTELGRSPVSDPVQLGKLDIGLFLQREARAVSAKLPDLSAATRGSLDDWLSLRAQLAQTTATPVRAEGDRALLLLESPSGPKEVWFAKSEGKWFPEAYLLEWDVRVERAESRCSQFARDGKAAQWLETLGGARDAFGELAASTTQAQFDTGMSSIAEAVGPELAQMALDSMLGGMGVKLNVGSIIYSPSTSAPDAGGAESVPRSEAPAVD